MDIVNEEYIIMGKKTAVCLLTLSSGFEIIGSSVCADHEDFVQSVGKLWAKKQAMAKLEELIQFTKQCKLS